MIKFLARTTVQAFAVYAVAKVLEETKLGENIIKGAFGLANVGLTKLGEVITAQQLAAQAAAQQAATQQQQYPRMGGV